MARSGEQRTALEWLPSRPHGRSSMKILQGRLATCLGPSWDSLRGERQWGRGGARAFSASSAGRQRSSGPSCLPALSDLIKLCCLQTAITSQVFAPTLDNEANYVTWSLPFQWWHLSALGSSSRSKIGGGGTQVFRACLPGIKGLIVQRPPHGC